MFFSTWFFLTYGTAQQVSKWEKAQFGICKVELSKYFLVLRFKIVCQTVLKYVDNIPARNNWISPFTQEPFEISKHVKATWFQNHQNSTSVCHNSSHDAIEKVTCRRCGQGNR